MKIPRPYKVKTAEGVFAFFTVAFTTNDKNAIPSEYWTHAIGAERVCDALNAAFAAGWKERGKRK